MCAKKAGQTASSVNNKIAAASIKATAINLIY